MPKFHLDTCFAADEGPLHAHMPACCATTLLTNPQHTARTRPHTLGLLERSHELLPYSSRAVNIHGALCARLASPPRACRRAFAPPALVSTMPKFNHARDHSGRTVPPCTRLGHTAAAASHCRRLPSPPRAAGPATLPAAMTTMQPDSAVDVTFHGLTFTVQPRGGGEPVQILKGLSGAVRSGRCLAIMGASGAGKVGRAWAGSGCALLHDAVDMAGQTLGGEQVPLQPPLSTLLAARMPYCSASPLGDHPLPSSPPAPDSPAPLAPADHPAGCAGRAHLHRHHWRRGAGQRQAAPPQVLPAHQVGAALGSCLFEKQLRGLTIGGLPLPGGVRCSSVCARARVLHRLPPLTSRSLPPPSLLSRSSYVQQRDVLMASATVREAITTAALLKLPRSMPAAEKRARVDSVLADLELEGCQVCGMIVAGCVVPPSHNARSRRGHELSLPFNRLCVELEGCQEGKRRVRLVAVGRGIRAWSAMCRRQRRGVRQLPPCTI